MFIIQNARTLQFYKAAEQPNEIGWINSKKDATRFWDEHEARVEIVWLLQHTELKDNTRIVAY